MSKGRAFRAKRVRRQANAALKFGPSAKPRHRSLSGRTGGVMAHKLKNWKSGKAAEAK